MELWFIFSLLSILALSGAEISQKLSISGKANISAITNNFVVWTLQGIVGLTLAVMLGQFSFSLNHLSIYKLLIIGVVYFIGGTLFYSSYKGNSPSISIIFGTISVVMSSILGSVFLGDSFNYVHVIGILLILSAIYFLNYDNKQRINQYNLLAIGGGICYGIAYTIDKSFVISLSPFLYLGLMCLTVAIVSLIVSWTRISSELKELKLNSYKPMLSSATFGSTFNLLTFFAYRNGANVGVTDAMNNSTVFLVILIEIFLLKDKTNLLKKFVSACIAVTGVVLLGLA